MRNVLLFAWLMLLTLSTNLPAEEISFSQQIAPILVRRCLGCHDNRKTEGRYALHTFTMLMKAGESDETPIVRGKPGDSYLFSKIIDSDESNRMPQEDDPLSRQDIDLIKRWIAAGANFDGPSKSDRLISLLPPRQHPMPPKIYRTSIPIFAMKFSPDGQTLLTGGWHEVLIWNVESGKLQSRITGLPQRIQTLAFSPDGSTLAVGGGAPGEYGEIRLVDLAKAQAYSAEKPMAHAVLTVWDDVVMDMQFSLDGKTLVAGGADNSVRGYDIESNKELWRTTQHVDWVTAVDITDYLFTERHIQNDETVKIFTFNEHEKKSGAHIQQHWQFPTGNFIVREGNWELAAIHDKDGMPTVSSLTKITITGIGKTYKVQRDTISKDAQKEHANVVDYLLKLHNDWPKDALGSEFVLSSSKDRTVKVCSRKDGRLFTTYKGHRREYGPLRGMHRVYGVQAEPETRRVWSGGEGNHFHGWNPVTVRDEDGTAADMEARFSKEYSIDLIRHSFQEPVFSLHRQANHLFAASASGKVKKFALSGTQAKFSLNDIPPHSKYEGHADHLFAVAAQANTSIVAAAGYTGEIVIWDAKTDTVSKRFIAAPMK